MGRNASDTLKSRWQVATLAQRAAEPQLAITNYEALLTAIKAADDNSVVGARVGAKSATVALRIILLCLLHGRFVFEW